MSADAVNPAGPGDADNPGNPHLAVPPVFFGAPAEAARTVVILIHGRNQSPGDMEQQIARRMNLADVAYVAPAAADQTWYPAGFMSPTEQNQPRLRFALERLAALSDDLVDRGTPLAAQVIMGFSQGACLGCEYVYRRQRRFRALCAFTGGLIGPPGTEWNLATDAFQGMPVLLGGASDDPWVPAARMQETAAVFQRLGAHVDATLYPSLGHAIADEQIARARAILNRLMERSP
jgi:phospholipase/carboxylesterase